MSRLVNRSIRLPERRISLRGEPELWDAIDFICARESIKPRDLFGRAEAALPGGSFACAVRGWVIKYLQDACGN